MAHFTRRQFLEDSLLAAAAAAAWPAGTRRWPSTSRVDPTAKSLPARNCAWRWSA